MTNPTTAIKLSNSTPTAPSGQQNIVFDSDGATPQQSVSASDPVMIGDTGSGGKAGNVPAPPSGSAAAGKFLKADGTFAVPAGSGGGITALTGDVTASGTGSVVATLEASGVTAGSYTNPNITVDAKGRVTSAADGAAELFAEPLTFNGEVLFLGGDVLMLGVDYGIGGGTGGGPPAFVQGAAANSVHVTTTSSVTAGNVLVVAASWEDSSSLPTCTDNLGTSYTRVFHEISADLNNLSMFVGIAPENGIATVTISGGTIGFAETSVCEFSGVTATVDAYNTAVGNASTPAPISITTTTDGDLIVCAIYGNHNATVYSAGTGFTLATFINGSDAQAIEYAVQSTAGTISGTFVATDNDDYALGVIALKPA